MFTRHVLFAKYRFASFCNPILGAKSGDQRLTIDERTSAKPIVFLRQVAEFHNLHIIFWGTHCSFEFVASKLIYANIHFQLVSNWGVGISLNQYNAMQSQCCIQGASLHPGTHIIRARILFCFFQNAGNGVSELQNFENPWGSMPPNPPRTGSLTRSLQPVFLVAAYG